MASHLGAQRRVDAAQRGRDVDAGRQPDPALPPRTASRRTACAGLEARKTRDRAPKPRAEAPAVPPSASERPSGMLAQGRRWPNLASSPGSETITGRRVHSRRARRTTTRLPGAARRTAPRSTQGCRRRDLPRRPRTATRSSASRQHDAAGDNAGDAQPSRYRQRFAEQPGCPERHRDEAQGSERISHADIEPLQGRGIEQRLDNEQRHARRRSSALAGPAAGSIASGRSAPAPSTPVHASTSSMPTSRALIALPVASVRC